MDARAALQSGDVRLALDLLKSDVRRAPRDARLRVFLFQMFCITGEWDRALAQLTLAGELDITALAMVQTYQIAIRCEVLRAKVYAGERTPTVFGEPGDWLPLVIEALRLFASGNAVAAGRLRDAAFEAAPMTPAIHDGHEAEWIADADPRIGPVVEAVVDGRYVWIPFARIRSVRLEPPADLRDQVWMPAHFTWENDGTAVGFIPTRYPGTTAAADPALLLARRTEWVEQDGWSIPVGQRVFVTDTTDVALLDLRHLELRPASPAAA